MLADVNAQSRADGLTGKAGAPAARHQRHAMLRGDLERGLQVAAMARQHHAERLDLVDAGGCGVELAAGAVERNFAFHLLAEMPLEGGPTMLAQLLVGGHEGSLFAAA